MLDLNARDPPLSKSIGDSGKQSLYVNSNMWHVNGSF